MEIISDKEKRLLGALYKLGNASISTLAKETMINRTALYHTMDTLLSKGLVTKIEKESVTYFQPLPFSAYEDWSQKQISLVTKKTKDLKDWLSGQQNDQPTLYSDIRYFEGKEGVEHLYADTWRDNKEKLIRCITDFDRGYETLNSFFENQYFPDRIENNVRVKSLALKGAVTGKRDIKRSKELLRDMRFIDIFKDLGIEINIYGSKVSIVAFDEKKPSGVIIKNKIISEAFLRIFEYMWKTCKE